MSQSFRLALKSLASSKMRSFLTMLGIIIGVGSVIILVSLMQGMTSYISDSFSDLGTDQISVSVTNTDTRKIGVDDMYEILENYPDTFRNMSPTVSVRATVKNGSESITSSTVSGVGEGALSSIRTSFPGRRYASSALMSRKSCSPGRIPWARL